MNSSIRNLVFTSALALTFAACGGGSSSTTTPTPPPGGGTGGGGTGGGGTGGSETISNCPDQITAGASLGITALPSGLDSSYTNNFCKYSEILAPNGKPIRFFAQNLVTNEQVVRAKSVLEFYLTDVPGSEYGADKSHIANKMADNGANLIMMNGFDQGEAPANGQTLFQTENVVEGSAVYMTNDPCDAAFEEILHMMHDTGIGVDGANSFPGVRTAYQTEIRAATDNAIAPGVITSGAQLGLWGSIAIDWLQELSAENSLTQEYLASVIDTYYGLAGQSTSGGSNDLYKPQTRDQIRTMDPMGWALVGGDSPRKFFSEYVTYNARIDSAFTGTFTLVFDAGTQYTHKSQYLLNATLTGSETTGLQGNAQANKLTGNIAANAINGGDGDDTLSGGSGSDTLDGGDGTDIAVFTGPSGEYTILRTNGSTMVTDNTADRDGEDTLINIETLQFSDGQQSN